jgi:hypothetical protein
MVNESLTVGGGGEAGAAKPNVPSQMKGRVLALEIPT